MVPSEPVSKILSDDLNKSKQENITLTNDDNKFNPSVKFNRPLKGANLRPNPVATGCK